MNWSNLRVDHHWCKGRDDFKFKKCYSEFLHTHFSQADIRQECSNTSLEKSKAKLNVLSMMKTLRSHPGDDKWRPDQSLTKWGVCMHQGYGPFRVSQSVGSIGFGNHSRFNDTLAHRHFSTLHWDFQTGLA